MSGIYFKFSDGEECGFTKDEIANETSVEDLIDWRDEIHEGIQEMRLMAESFKLGGVEDHGLCYKLGNTRILHKWIVTRLTKLGHISPDQGTEREINQAKEIQRLLDKVAKLERQITLMDS